MVPLVVVAVVAAFVPMWGVLFRVFVSLGL